MPTWQNGADIRKAQAAADRKAANKKAEQPATQTSTDDKPKGR